MASRSQRAAIAAETVAIVQAGQYTPASGKIVSIREAVAASIIRTALIGPEERVEHAMPRKSFVTSFEVRNETTFAAARRLVGKFGADRVAALNFASAKNPGGGFLNGSQAQEESLARASGLVACLERQEGYYQANRNSRTSLYTDHLIISPRVPVFRDDQDELLEEPWEVTILTSPAPNAGAVANNEPHAVDQIEPTFRKRIEQVLSVAAAYGHSALVLGAWGCGVFGNDPAMVARLFGEFLLPGGGFATTFEHVSFAVLDRQGQTLAAFANVFGEEMKDTLP